MVGRQQFPRRWAALLLVGLLCACGRRTDLDGGAYGPPPPPPAPHSETPLSGGPSEFAGADRGGYGDRYGQGLAPGLLSHEEIDPATGRHYLVISNAPIANPVSHRHSWRVERRRVARWTPYPANRVRQRFGDERQQYARIASSMLPSASASPVAPVQPAPVTTLPAASASPSQPAPRAASGAAGPGSAASIPAAPDSAGASSSSQSSFGLTMSPFLWLVAAIVLVALILMMLFGRRRRRPTRAARPTGSHAGG